MFKTLYLIIHLSGLCNYYVDGTPRGVKSEFSLTQKISVAEKRAQDGDKVYKITIDGVTELVMHPQYYPEFKEVETAKE